MSYIAYLDLLGIKDLAISLHKKYNLLIKEFQEIIRNGVNNIFGEEKQLVVFSDCLYLENNNLDKILKFLQEIREKLFAKQLFFNCAIIEGTLGINAVSKDNFTSIYLESADIVKVFSAQSRFTGIGINVDLKNAKNKLLFKSVYCVEYNNNDDMKFKEYIDIKYKNITMETIVCLLQNYVKTLTYNFRAARYYYSAIIGVINQLEEEQIRQFLERLDFTKVRHHKIYETNLYPIHLALINRIYDIYKQKKEYETEDINFNLNLTEYLDEIINISIFKEGKIDLKKITETLMSSQNKYLFAEYLSLLQKKV